jgi:hypothetical protein
LILISIVLFVCLLLIISKDEPIIQDEEDLIIGDDRQIWRKYSEDYVLADDFSICVSGQTDENFYAVYRSSDGTRIGTLLLDDYLIEDEINSFRLWDYNQDGVKEIGIQMYDQKTLWFWYRPSEKGWPKDVTGGFQLIEDDVECPYAPYAFDQLNEPQVELYETMKEKVDAMEPFSYEAAIYGYDTLDNLFVAWSALSTDYPEINNYFYIWENINDEGTTVSLDSYYVCLWENEQTQDITEISNGLNVFDKICDDIIAQMPADASAYDKYFYLASALSNHVEYDHTLDQPANYTPYCIVTGNGICQGYAQAYQYLCMKADLWCKVVSGASNGESHAWNTVMINNGIYHVDVTWADEQGEPGSTGWMNYFMLNEEQILQDHEIFAQSY